jgi:uncharacterized DUF497 family protein
MAKTNFEWDAAKNTLNLEKHGVSFQLAQYAFADPLRVIAQDESHSQAEARFYCFGVVESGILTVRFTYRAAVIRIIGAGYWRKGKAIYELENKIHE